MRTIHFQIEDNLYDEIVKKGINIQDELKLALNKILSKKESYLNSQQFQEDKAYFNNALDEIASGEVKLLSHDDVWEQIEKHSKAN